MSLTEHHFDLKKIARWCVKEEVKTPLSFFFKVIPYMTAAWLGILYAPGLDGNIKFSLIKFSAWVFVGLCSLVVLFAFFRPKHLVYGEAGHRAEKKMEFGEFGTEKRTFAKSLTSWSPPKTQMSLQQAGGRPRENPNHRLRATESIQELFFVL